LLNKSFIEEENQYSTQEDATYNSMDHDNQLQENSKENNEKSSTNNFKAYIEIKQENSETSGINSH
jgi:hypothetical protein